MIATVLEANPKQAAEAKNDPKIVGWLMGQILRLSPTKLDPNTVRAAILEQL
jgi:Asp-tRNA(Asn)/Glu-tRNA(Gln) amidotransferase B subunit